MSEQGWKDFLAAEGVDDWVVLHGGAAAVFRSHRSKRQLGWRVRLPPYRRWLGRVRS